MNGQDSVDPAPRTVSALAKRVEGAQLEADLYRLHAERRECLRAAVEAHSRKIEEDLITRGRYVAAVNHELRTPITAIMGYHELLERGVFGPLSARHAEVMRKISASAHQLLALVDDMLDLSKMDAGMITIDRRATNVPDVVSECTGAVEVQARKKDIVLRVDCPPGLPVIHTDQARTRQILYNLLSNAIKFTREGRIIVHVRHLASAGQELSGPEPAAVPGKDGWIRIAVEDTGIGIEPDQIHAIFEEFVQTESGRRAGGTGLGLTISRRLARLLGGDVTAQSTAGARSTFALFLPCPDRPESLGL